MNLWFNDDVQTAYGVGNGYIVTIFKPLRLSVRYGD